MKMNLVFKGLMMAALLTASMHASAAPKVACAKNEKDIQKFAAVLKVVQRAGGISNLEGGWALTGLAAMVKNVEINFRANSNALLAQIKGLDENISTEFGEIQACSTQKANELKINVIDAKATLYMRVVNANTLQFAQVEKGKVGQFHTFKKIQ